MPPRPPIPTQRFSFLPSSSFFYSFFFPSFNQSSFILTPPFSRSSFQLPGTIFTSAKEVEKAGGKALAVVCDIRSEEQVKDAIQKAVDRFGGIDILINNASAISLTSTTETDMKKFDLMNQINLRGTFMVSKYAIPHLLESAKKGRNPHILNLSPPLSMREKWFSPHVAYTTAKYGMSLCVLGMSGELRDQGIAVNALWPLTAIATSAIDLIVGEEARQGSRTDEIMSDAAYVILVQESSAYTGNFCIDEEVLRSQGVVDFSKYNVVPGAELNEDFFVDPEIRAARPALSESFLKNFKSKI